MAASGRGRIEGTEQRSPFEVGRDRRSFSGGGGEKEGVKFVILDGTLFFNHKVGGAGTLGMLGDHF